MCLSRNRYSGTDRCAQAAAAGSPGVLPRGPSTLRGGRARPHVAPTWCSGSGAGSGAAGEAPGEAPGAAAMQRRKVDNRIRVLIENGVAERQRSLFVVVGDRGKDQVTPSRRVRGLRGLSPTRACSNSAAPAPLCLQRELNLHSAGGQWALRGENSQGQRDWKCLPQTSPVWEAREHQMKLRTACGLRVWFGVFKLG